MDEAVKTSAPRRRGGRDVQRISESIRHREKEVTRREIASRRDGVHSKIILVAPCANRTQMTGAGRQRHGGLLNVRGPSRH